MIDDFKQVCYLELSDWLGHYTCLFLNKPQVSNPGLSLFLGEDEAVATWVVSLLYLYGGWVHVPMLAFVVDLSIGALYL